MRRVRRRLGGGIVALTVLALVGCDAQAPANEEAVATQGPVGGSSAEQGAPLTPGDAQSGWDTWDLGAVTISAPAGFTEIQGAAPVGERITNRALRLGDVDGERAGISVSIDVAPQRDAATAADVAVQAQRAQHGLDEFVSATITWPGTDAAHYLTYEQDIDVTGAGLVVHFRAAWVYADLPDGSQVAVGALAPVEMFDELDLHDALATWRPSP